MMRKVISISAFILAYSSCICNGFMTPTKKPVALSQLAASSLVASLDDTFVRPDTIQAGISEQACADAAAKMQRINVPVSETVSESGEVGISFIHFKPEIIKKGTLPLLLIHGFDSSCLEYRRLGPQLAALGIDTYAVDLLGWGYTQLNDVKSFSAQSKVEALNAFWQTVGNGRDVCIGGASLGGAASIEFAANNPLVKGCVLIDAQGFVDGVGPMASLPKFLAQAGVKVLKSNPLRNSANQMSYYDKETFATEDALRVGRLHCLRDGWDDALVSFMLSGGFYPSEKVAQIESPSLVLWGRQDTILEIGFAQKFVDTLPDGKLEWVEECGHVPHLEQPKQTAELICSFLSEDKLQTDDMTLDSSNNGPGLIVTSLAGAALIGTAAVTTILGS